MIDRFTTHPALPWLCFTSPSLSLFSLLSFSRSPSSYTYQDVLSLSLPLSFSLLFILFFSSPIPLSFLRLSPSPPPAVHHLFLFFSAIAVSIFSVHTFVWMEKPIQLIITTFTKGQSKFPLIVEEHNASNVSTLLIKSRSSVYFLDLKMFAFSGQLKIHLHVNTSRTFVIPVFVIEGSLFPWYYTLLAIYFIFWFKRKKK